jgi:uncharacterized protein (DUF1501 family)
MKRRDFLKGAVPATLLPLALGGFSIKAYGRSPLLSRLLASAANTDRVLVLIQLNGGNDGLNTVIPLDQYSSYNTVRSNIAIPEAQVLKLTNATGLHPQMTGVQSLYTSGKVRVVQSVGYPNPDFSHFRSTDIWLTASDYDQVVNTGWMGRYLDQEFPGYPNGYPNATMPDPLAIQIGSSLSTGLEGPAANMGMSFSNPASFYNIVSGTNEPVPNGRAGVELDYIRNVGKQLDTFGATVKAAAGRAANKSGLYPAAKQNTLADQLKIVATLIAGGLKTRIYVVNLGGFDTHSNQNSGGAGTPTPHGTLLNQLSVAIAAFQDDIRLLGIEDRIVGMTFSEFGRRIRSNGSAGTDHGAAAPLIVFGTNVIPGVLGPNPTIDSDASPNDNIPMLYDFRSVYASLLKDWFGAPDSELRSVLFRDYQILPIIKGTSSSVAEDGSESAIMLAQNMPNPFTSSTRVRFTARGGAVRLDLFDARGARVRTVVDRDLSAGEHEVVIEADGLPSGTYYCRLQNAGRQAMRTMVVER